MSSSAALEMSFAYAFGVLANVDLGPVEWARVGQGAENHYVGARTGLLDQFSSIMGREDHLVYSDFRTLEVTRVPLPAGVALVVANTKVKHTLTHEYNERREACERAVAFLQQRAPGVRALRDVSRAELEAAGEAGLDPVVLRRARHVVTENERVFAGVQDLSQGRIRDFGGRMFTSHDSSRLDFENSCAELDVLVETARGLSDCYGARLSGGGFGGITVHLVRQDEASAYGRALADAYEARLGGRPEVMVCRAAAGAAVL
jgi:galactokinase